MSSPFINFTREEWGRLRASTPLTLSEDDVEEIRGINVELSMADVEQSYLPLSRLLNLYVRASQQLFSVMDTFLGKPTAPVPYIIGIAGSVAVGKSTTARVLQELLSRWPDHPSVDLITTDGFLLPNSELERRGLMDRKGFPESFDRKALLKFVSALKSGVDEVSAPIYSHITYDIVPDKKRVVSHPDIVIIEGLNVLQGGDTGTYVSDYFDFSIYVDAEVADIERWYIERFHTFTRTAFRREDSYFRQYAELTEAEAEATAREIWKSINEVNLFENILHTRERATLILRKDGDHQTEQIKLRRP